VQGRIPISHVITPKAWPHHHMANFLLRDWVKRGFTAIGSTGDQEK
jgi:hypothetical protein